MCKLSVVICSYNREKYIAESINAALNQSVSLVDYQIVVVNNNSTDATDTICLELLSEGKQFDYVVEIKQGLSHARNRGIDEARGEIIVFVDDDAMMEPNYVENVLTFFSEKDSISAVGGRIFPRYEEKNANWMSPVLMPLIAALDMGNQPKPFRMGKFPIGANMAFRKSVFDKIGTFNVELGRNGNSLQGGEEKDIFARMRAVNMDIWYCPYIVVYHVIPTSRLQKSYIKRMGIGIGESEYIRTKSISNSAFIIAGLKEFMKWGVTFVLAFGYFLTFQFPKAIMLLQFRSWVSNGLFFNSIKLENESIVK